MITLNVQEDAVMLHTEQAVVVGGPSNVDFAPLEGSRNAVSSGGVYAAIGASDHVNAQKVRFDDGESFQEKLASGKLKGSGDELPLIFSKKLTETTTSIIVNKNANGAAFLLNE